MTITTTLATPSLAGAADAPFLIGPLVLSVDRALLALAPLAALIGAGVFLLAAGTKLIGPTRTTREFAALGLPLPAVLARLVPVAEVAIAVALLTRPIVGAVAATSALLAFTAVLTAVLRSGRTVSCGCLGAVSDQPVSGITIARNLALVATVLLAAAAPDPAGFRIALPSLAVVLAAGSAALLAALGTQVAVLHDQLGRIWSVELAGESGANRSSRPTRNRHQEAPAS